MLTAQSGARGNLSTSPSGPGTALDNRGMTTSDTPDLGRFLTLADTAEILNVSPRQAYSLVRSGELPAIQIGARGAWRVERAMLDSYIAAKYEESRHLARWRQANFADVTELFAPERTQ